MRMSDIKTCTDKRSIRDITNQWSGKREKKWELSDRAGTGITNQSLTSKRTICRGTNRHTLLSLLDLKMSTKGKI